MLLDALSLILVTKILLMQKLTYHTDDDYNDNDHDDHNDFHLILCLQDI